MAQNISLVPLEQRQGARVALSATDGPSKRPLFAQESKRRAPKKPATNATWAPQSGHCGEAQESQSVGFQGDRISPALARHAGQLSRHARSQIGRFGGVP